MYIIYYIIYSTKIKSQKLIMTAYSNSNILTDDLILQLSESFSFKQTSKICNDDCASTSSSITVDEEDQLKQDSLFYENPAQYYHNKLSQKQEPQKYNKSKYQKRFNNLVLNVEKISFMDRIRLRCK